MEFYFDEHLRLDWGLGNPNKTATLIACLMILVHGIRHLAGGKKWGLPVFAILFLGLGLCLIHTYSRGGILAAVIGQAAYVLVHTRGRLGALSRKGWIIGAALTLGLAVYSILPSVGAASRYGQGIVPGAEDDRSISNRLRIWRDVPQMMVDAPNGWGIGKSGDAWMKWYQPMETRYQYRTLVNSHLTWLVELGWIGRFLYVAGWGLVTALCFVFSVRGRSGSCVAAITAGVWSAFGVSAFFSSVAESWILWIIPGACLCWILAHIGREKLMRLRDFGIVSTAAVLILAIVAGVGMVQNHVDGVKVRFNGNAIIVGDGEPSNILIKPKEHILGRYYSYEIRKAASADEGWSIYSEIPKTVPPSAIRLILSGGESEMPAQFTGFEGEIFWINPEKIPLKKAGLKGGREIILGGLRRDSVARTLNSSNPVGWEISKIPGKKIYIGNWLDAVFRPPN